jgi:hypothetical protein
MLVRLSLDTLPKRWTRRDGPISWPPHSPDFTPLYFFVWSTSRTSRACLRPRRDHQSLLRCQIKRGKKQSTSLTLCTNKRSYLPDAAIIMTAAMFFSKWWPEIGKVKRGHCVLYTTRSITAWGKEECFRHILLTDFIRDQKVSIDLWTVRLHSNAMFRLRFAALYSISVTHWFILPLATGDIHSTVTSKKFYSPV